MGFKSPRTLRDLTKKMMRHEYNGYLGYQTRPLFCPQLLVCNAKLLVKRTVHRDVPKIETAADVTVDEGAPQKTEEK